MELDAATEQALAKGRRLLMSTVPESWPALARLIAGSWPEAHPSALLSLPLAAALVCEGDPDDAAPVAAWWGGMNLALRILDDLQDRDRAGGLWASWGDARGFNAAAALRELSTAALIAGVDDDRQLAALLRDATMGLSRVVAGQELDLTSIGHDVPGWWHVNRLKSGELFALVLRLGARASDAEEEEIEALSKAGLELGMALQLVDDWASTDPAGDARDLLIGKASFAVRTGLQVARGAEREQLEALVDSPPPWPVAEVGGLLDRCGARGYTLWSAWEAAGRAREALAPFPAPRRALIEAYLDAALPPLPDSGPSTVA